MSVIVVVLQFIAAAAAVAGLFVLAASIAKRYGTAGVIVALGAAARAAGAAVLFWLSYLQAPFARSLQLGDGLWFFALDGQAYMKLARTAAEHPFAIVPIFNPNIPSPAYVQLLTFAVILFGSSAAIGALLNVFAYLFLGRVLARAAQGGGNIALAIAGVYAFAPGPMLWSMQPLKDVPFVAAELLLPIAMLKWQQAIGGEELQWKRAAAALATLVISIYFMAGVREYYAIMVAGALAVAFVVVVACARQRLIAASATLVALVLCIGAILASAPGSLHLRSTPEITPDVVSSTVEATRSGFEKTPASTAISVGPTMEALPVRSLQLEILFSNCAAVLLPRVLGVPLGLFSVGGGRGLWAFAELDTLAFDLAVVLAIVGCWRRFGKRDLWNAVVWLVGFMLLLTLPIIYVVNNFGTLFRFRMMLLLPILFLPLVVSGRRAAAERDAQDSAARLTSGELEQTS